jgi:hypothetical protein
MAKAIDFVHAFKPQDHLDQAIYRDILRGASPEELEYETVAVNPRQITLEYKVKSLPSDDSQAEAASVGKLAVTSLLVARAILTRRPADLTGAICAGAVTLIGGEETFRRAKSAFQRVFKQDLGKLKFRIQPGQAAITYQDQEVQISLAPLKQVATRAIRQAGENDKDAKYSLHLDFQDGRVVTLLRGLSSVEARKLGHQVAQALHSPIVFQSIAVSEVKNGYSWELGPQLVEPALN